MNARLPAFALVMLLAPAVFAQDYAIRLDRPLKAGDELKISATAKQSTTQTLTLNGTPQKNDKDESSVQFEGVEKVIAVDADGKETKLSLTVGSLTQTVSGTTKEVVPKGTVIICSSDTHNETYEIDGKPAEEAVGDALDMILDMSQGKPGYDEGYGTKERKKKGDSWDLNPEKAKSLVEDLGVLSNLAGKGTLDDVVGDSLKISVHFTADFKPKLPDPMIVDKAWMDITMKGTFPIDTSKYETENLWSVTSSFTAHADLPAGKAVFISTTEGSTSRTITPLK